MQFFYNHTGNAAVNQRAILEPVFPHRIFTRGATFFFFLSLIISTWSQPKAQGQRKKVASRENIR